MVEQQFPNVYKSLVICLIDQPDPSDFTPFDSSIWNLTGFGHWRFDVQVLLDGQLT